MLKKRAEISTKRRKAEVAEEIAESGRIPWTAEALLPLSPRQPCCPALRGGDVGGEKRAFSSSGVG